MPGMRNARSKKIELLFLHSVDPLELLLLAELKAVIRALSRPSIGGLAGG